MNDRRFTRGGEKSVRRAACVTMERLEGRVLFAYDATLSLGPTIGFTSSTSNGTTTFTASGPGANLSWADVAGQMAGGDNVVVSSGSGGTEAGNIADQAPTGTAIDNAAGTTLTLESGSGANLVGNISLGSATLNGANSSVIISASGSISGGVIQAPELGLSGATGIGSASNPLLTQASSLVAHAGSGGVFVSNTGDLTVGYAGEPFSGVTAESASPISITNRGSILLTQSNDNLTTGGFITLRAQGPTADLRTGGGFTQISGTGASNLTIQAGRDVLVGSSSGQGNVVATGLVSVTAGRDVVIDDGAQLGSFFGSSGSVSVLAGRNIALLASNGTSGALLGASGGTVALSTGPGGTFTLNSGAGGQINSGFTNSPGALTISADNMVIDDPISAAGNTVTLQPSGTTPREIDLGLGTTAGDLGLSDAELRQMTAATLRIGRPDNSGNLDLTAPISTHSGFNTLSLRTAGAIQGSTSGPAIMVANLALWAGSGIGSADGSSQFNTAVSNLAFQNGSGPLAIYNGIGLTIAAVDGFSVSSNSGTTTQLSTGSPIRFAVNTSSGGTLTATANESTPATPGLDDVTVSPGVTVQSIGGDVIFKAGDDITIGSTALVQAPAGNITFASAFNDNDGEGAISLAGSLVSDPSAGIITLNTGVEQGATEASTGSLTASGLLLSNKASASFVLDSALNRVGTLAASTLGPVTYVNQTALTVGTIGNTAGLTLGGALSLSGPSINLAANITTANADQSFLGPVVLQSDTTLSAGTGKISFAQSVSGPYALTLSSGAVTFGGPVSSLSSISAIAAGGATNVDPGLPSAPASSASATDSTQTNPAPAPNGATDAAGAAAVGVSQASSGASSITAVGSTVVSNSGRRGFVNVPVAAFTVPNATATSSDFSIQIDWGDGTVGGAKVVQAGAGVFVVLGSHTYKNSRHRSYPLILEIRDSAGAAAAVRSNAVLFNGDDDDSQDGDD